MCVSSCGWVTARLLLRKETPRTCENAPAAAAAHGRIGTGRQPSLSLSLPGRKIVGPPPPGRAEYGACRRTLRMARPRRSSACARCARRRSPPRISENRGLGRRGPVMQHLLPLGLRGDERPRRRRGSGQAHGVVAGTDRLSARPVSISSAWATAELRRRPISSPLGSSGRFENSQIVCD